MRPDDAQVTKAFDEAPEVVRYALTDGVAVDFMAKLPSRYGMHIDTAGYVTEFIRNMLLGFIRPEQFIGKLNSVGINDQVARQITTDLNKEVFMPLRDEMRKTGGTLAPHAIPHVAVMSVEAPKREESIKKPMPSAPIVSEQPSYNLVPAIPNTTAASQQPAPAVRPQPFAPVPTMRTMQHDMELVEHGSMPAAYPAPVNQLHPAQATPARMFQTASVPVTAPAAPALPREIVHMVPDAPPQLPPSQPRHMPNIAPVKEYTSDPYREPI